MKRVDRENYEMFALDYLEGNLTAERLAEFERFLSENPDIGSQFSGLAEHIPQITPDEGVVFAGKAGLKRHGKIPLWLAFASGAAAVLVVGLVLYLIVGTGTEQLSRQSMTADNVPVHKTPPVETNEEHPADITQLSNALAGVTGQELEVVEINKEYPEEKLTEEMRANETRQNDKLQKITVIEPEIKAPSVEIASLDYMVGLNAGLLEEEGDSLDSEEYLAELEIPEENANIDVQVNNFFQKDVIGAIAEDFAYIIKGMNPLNVLEKNSVKQGEYDEEDVAVRSIASIFKKKKRANDEYYEEQ